MKMTYERMASLLLGGRIRLSAAVTPVAVRGISISAPIGPGEARAFGFTAGSALTIGAFQKPRRVRVCVTESTPASPDVGACVIADHSQIVVPVSNCGEVVGTRMIVEPAGALGGNRQVKGVYSIIG